MMDYMTGKVSYKWFNNARKRKHLHHVW